MYYNAGGRHPETDLKGERVGIALSKDMKTWKQMCIRDSIFMFLKILFMSLFLYISYLLLANWLLQIYKIKRGKSIAF